MDLTKLLKIKLESDNTEINSSIRELEFMFTNISISIFNKSFQCYMKVVKNYFDVGKFNDFINDKKFDRNNLKLSVLTEYFRDRGYDLFLAATNNAKRFVGKLLLVVEKDGIRDVYQCKEVANNKIHIVKLIGCYIRGPYQLFTIDPGEIIVGDVDNN